MYNNIMEIKRNNSSVNIYRTVTDKQAFHYQANINGIEFFIMEQYVSADDNSVEGKMYYLIKS